MTVPALEWVTTEAGWHQLAESHICLIFQSVCVRVCVWLMFVCICAFVRVNAGVCVEVRGQSEGFVCLYFLHQASWPKSLWAPVPIFL